MKILNKNLLLLPLLLSGTVYASQRDIISTVEKLGLKKSEFKITNSELPNFKMVTTADGVFYVSNDGKFLTQGPIYNMEGEKPVNLANDNNLRLIQSIDKEAIVYQAENEKYVIYVFTDYTCHYCKTLHEHMDDYLKAGISVHYFAFPRAGVDSKVGEDMQSIWSTKDRKTAFDNAYKTGKITSASSMVPYVKMQYDVGRQLGLTGTPAIILPNGQLLAGYVPADKLLEILNEQ
ncbi:bifunctional protein-disulfide isomerase/oxidoreductase DsbC [Orbaceae bacterium ac157xtp]